jgi:hypothetical protein
VPEGIGGIQGQPETRAPTLRPGTDGSTVTLVVVLSELEIFCSRPHAPTRRVALGASSLPCDPAPGFGGILLGGVIANFVPAIDPELIDDLKRLTRNLEEGRTVSQPCLRHRLQVDTVGLNSVRHRLLGEGERLTFDFDTSGVAEQQVLGAVYAAAELDGATRRSVMRTIRSAIDWSGPVGADLIASLSGIRTGGSLGRMALENPMAWALDQLGFTRPDEAPFLRAGVAPDPKDVQRRYREMLREVHPDHGAASEGAALRIAELGEARRILTGR